MAERPPERRRLDLASASAACAPTEKEIAEAWQRPSSVARDQRPGRPLEEVPSPGRLPKPSPAELPTDPEPEGELTPGEETRVRDAASGRVSLRLAVGGRA